MTNKVENLSSSLRVQLRVIWALYLREIITRYGRHNLGFLWLFLEPMLVTLLITVLWNTTRDAASFKLPITAFAVTGYSSVILWRNMVNRCSGAMVPNIGLLYHRNVRVIDVFVSRILLELAGTTISFIAISALFITAGLMNLPVDVLQVVLGWFLLAWFGASLALVVGCLSEKYDMVEKLWHPFSFILFPLSGLAFMVDWLSSDARQFVLWLPMVSGLEYLREGYFGGQVTAHYNLKYFSLFCLTLTFFGLLLARDVGRSVNPA